MTFFRISFAVAATNPSREQPLRSKLFILRYRPVKTKTTMAVAQKYCESFGTDLCPSSLLSVKSAQFLTENLGKEIIRRPHIPTNPFAILELQNPSHDIPAPKKIRRSPDLEALTL